MIDEGIITEVYRILIVEGDGTIAKQLERLLTGLGYDVVGIVSTGEQALQYVAERSPDLVLVDIELAGEVDGVELAARLRDRFDVPIVYLSAHPERMAMEDVKRTQPYGFLSKPVRDQELHATVEIALYKHRMTTRLQRAEEAREQHIRELQTITQTIVEASCLEEIDALCELIGKVVREENEGAFVIVSLYDRTMDAIRVRALLGAEKTFERFRAVFSQALTLTQGDVSGPIRPYASGRLERVPDGLYALAAGKIPREVCREIEEEANIGPVYTVGFALEEKPYGGIAILLPQGSGEEQIRGRSVIQTLASHFSVMMQRRQAEQALRESEKRYRSLVETFPGSIVLTNLDGTILFCNQQTAAMYGVEQADELVGQSAFTFVAPAYRGDAQARAKSVLAGAKVQSIEYEVIKKDGSQFMAELSASAIKDERGDPQAIIGVTWDITARKQAEEALRRSEWRLRHAQRIGKMGHWDFDVETETITWSEMTYELYERDPQLGPPTFEEDMALHHPRDAARLRACVRRALQQAEPYEIDLRTDLPSGRMIYLHAIGVPIVDDRGRVVRLEGTVQDVTERKQMEEALRQRTAQLEVLQDISLAITAQLDLDALLQEIVEQGSRLLKVQGASLYLVDEMTGYLEQVVSYNYKRDHSGSRLAPGEGLAGKVLERGEPMSVDNYSQWEGRASSWEDEEITGSLSVPLKHDGRIIGTLGFEELGKPRSFDEQDIWLATLFATQATTAIRNARLYEEVQRRVAQSTLIHEVSQRVSSELELDDLLPAVVSVIRDAFDYYNVSLLLLDEKTERLRIQTTAGAYADEFPADLSLAIGEGMTGYAVATGKTLVSNDVSQDPHYVCITPVETRSELVAPIKSGQRVIGVLDVKSDKLDAFDEVDVATVETLSAQTAIAIENGRLFQAEKEQRELAEALVLASAAVSSALNLDEVLDRILEQVARVVHADAFNIMLIENGYARVVRSRGYERFGVEDLVSSISFHIPDVSNLQQMSEDGKPIIIEDTVTFPNWVDIPEQRWLRSYVGVPIKAGGIIVGFLNVDSSEPNQFSRDDAQRLEAFASHAAIAIENAQLYQELRSYAVHLEERVAERTAQLQAQFAQLEAILDSTVDGIVVTDGDGAFILVNPVAQTWLSRTLSSDEAGLLQEAVQDLVRRTLALPPQLRTEKRARKRLELTGLDLELSAASIVGPSTGQAKAVVAIHDVSHLEALNRMKSRFVSNVSHELRTPITTIKLYAHLMESQPENWQKYLEPLTKEADHQAHLVEDILEISRVDAGRLTLNPRPTDLNTLIDTLIKSHETLIQKHGLSLERRTIEARPIVSLDVKRMMQVLNNLVSNAIRYTPEGGSLIIATDETEAQGRTWATVMVEDTGIGIPEEELPHVFDRFFRGEEPQTRQIPGTGLGLAIVKEIVALHGGRVTVESEVGVGSVFTVWLPLSLAEKPHTHTTLAEKGFNDI